jgi:5S rRNA maturation endonuclease (ribonuclease M5)
MSRNLKNETVEIPNSTIYQIESYIESMKITLDDLKSALKPKMRFDSVKAKLSPNIIESIFREFAGKIKPDDDFKKSGMRISKGSLNMDLMSGIWNRFSNGSKGDIFSFIALAEGISDREALDVVANRVGIKKLNHYTTFNTSVGACKQNESELRPKTSSSINNDLATATQKDEWIAFDILPVDAKAFIPERDLSFMLKGTVIEEIYEYKNKFDRLLGYCIRIYNKAEDKKQVMPVAYCYNKAKKEERWQLKGFLDNGYKPIYRAEILSRDVIKPVLIVEGEKAVHAAAKLFPSFAVISWMGGSQAIKKVNWSQIKGREVVIWPDNDEPGIAAANNIKYELGQINEFLSLVNIVDVISLNLPEKWDLADERPSHISVARLNMIMNDALQVK